MIIDADPDGKLKEKKKSYDRSIPWSYVGVASKPLNTLPFEKSHVWSIRNAKGWVIYIYIYYGYPNQFTYSQLIFQDFKINNTLH